MIDQGVLVVISGPSGAGKGTLCKEIIKNNDIYLSVSVTTRSPREGEVEGKSYYFISREEFEEKIQNNEFLEYAEVYGNYYGTLKSKVLDKIETGKDIILEIDIQGATQVKQNYPKGVFIFILPPSMEELRRRIINRHTETEESLMRRFKSAYKEINSVSRYNYAVINDEVSVATKKIESIIVAEKCRMDRIKNKIFDAEGGIIHEQFYDKSVNSWSVKESGQ